MAQKYFSSFPEVDYTLPDDSRILLTDITPGIVSRQNSLDKLLSYSTYEISDGERPDIISQILYGTPTYAWTFFQINDFLRGGINSWPKTSSELSSLILAKYENFGILTLDPMTFIGERDDNIYGSLILFNFEKYASSNSLKLRTIKDGVVSNEEVTVVGFNRNLLQIMVDTSALQNIDLFFSGTEFVLSVTDEDIREQFTTDFENSHGFSVDIIEDVVYEILLDIRLRPFNWSRMKDAPIEYINVRTGATETVAMFATTGRNENIFIDLQNNGEDALQNNGDRILAPETPGFININSPPNRTVNVSLNPSIRWITYEESEIRKNESNKKIRVIDPSLIRNFAKKYFSVLESM